MTTHDITTSRNVVVPWVVMLHRFPAVAPEHSGVPLAKSDPIAQIECHDLPT